MLVYLLTMRIASLSDNQNDNLVPLLPNACGSNSRTLRLKASGCAPVDRVRSLGQHDKLGAGDMGELPAA